MFDIYSQAGQNEQNVHGKLVKTEEKIGLLYSNTHTVNVDGVCQQIEQGSSYEIIDSDGEPIEINFAGRGEESGHITEGMLLEMLIHRVQSRIDSGLVKDADKALMFCNSLKLSLDVFRLKLA